MLPLGRLTEYLEKLAVCICLKLLEWSVSCGLFLDEYACNKEKEEF